MPHPERHTHHLRRGRVSLPGARYFLTLCTRDRTPVLTAPAEMSRLLATLRTLHTAGDCEVLAATIMPDHVHLLFTLGSILTLGQTMAKFKNLARDLGRAPWRWLDDGFEHWLRPDESPEDYAFYIFMNPYRARLVDTTVPWPAWHCPDPTRLRFLAHLHANGTPPPEWLAQIEETARRIPGAD